MRASIKIFGQRGHIYGFCMPHHCLLLQQTHWCVLNIGKWINRLQIRRRTTMMNNIPFPLYRLQPNKYRSFSLKRATCRSTGPPNFHNFLQQNSHQYFFHITNLRSIKPIVSGVSPKSYVAFAVYGKKTFIFATRFNQLFDWYTKLGMRVNQLNWWLFG